MALDRFQIVTIDLLNEIATKLESGYKSINVSFYQKQSNNSVVYTQLSNNSGYSFDIQGVSAGVIEVITDIPDYRNTQVFMSPLTHPSDYCSTELISGDPYVFRLYSIGIGGGGADPRGFGNDGLSRATFEIRIYPEPA